MYICTCGCALLHAHTFLSAHPLLYTHPLVCTPSLSLPPLFKNTASLSLPFLVKLTQARAHGIRCGDGVGAGGRAAIPHLIAMQAKSIHQAQQQCPGLVVLPMRTSRYREVGGVREVGGGGGG